MGSVGSTGPNGEDLEGEWRVLTRGTQSNDVQGAPHRESTADTREEFDEKDIAAQLGACGTERWAASATDESKPQGRPSLITTIAYRIGQPPPLPLPDYSFVGLAAHQMPSVRSSLSRVASALSWKIARYIPSPYAIRNTHLSRSTRR